MPEYFIKLDEEAKGPFSVEELRAFVRAGKITSQTSHFYDDLIGWQPFSENEKLCRELFEEPTKTTPKLSLKEPVLPAQAPTKAPKITVEEMLKEAEGRGTATKKLTAQKRSEDRVGALSLPFLALFELGMGGLMTFAHWEDVRLLLDGQLSLLTFLGAPGFFLGVCIFAFGVLLLLSMVSIYPAVRYMAVVLLAYLGIHSWSYLYEGLDAGWMLLGAGVGYGLGVYTLTLTLRMGIFVVGVLAALAGIGSYAMFVYLGL